VISGIRYINGVSVEDMQTQRSCIRNFNNAIIMFGYKCILVNVSMKFMKNSARFLPSEIYRGVFVENRQTVRIEIAFILKIET
jgi:hypothetical protein